MHACRAAVVAAVVVLVAALAPATAVAGDTTNPWLDRPVLHIAHQGGEREAPSNTLYALRTAVDKGADMLEIDVHAAADGELVVVHDDTVDRTTDGSGRVDDLTVEELKELDAAHWFAEGCGACPDADDHPYRGYATGDRPIPDDLNAEPNDFTIPTLREVLHRFPDQLINIEIKATVPDTTPYERELAALLDEFDRADDTIVASFSDTAMALFAKQRSAVSTAPGLLQIGTFVLAAQGPLPGVRLPGHHALQVPIAYEGIPIVSADFVADAHANGLAVHVWTISDPDEMRRLLDIGVDGIMTDRPSVLAEVLAEYD